ncbi:MAG TPA: hypothetical protein VJT82_06795 [Pyrinomonadaceae bacterium]|nr:hypothetical protein [Pyrinomonadaceae bacterium]
MNRTTPRAARFALLWLCLSVLAASSAAQTRPSNDAAPPPAASPTPAPTAATDDNSDLSITASVTARELKFEVVPNPKVEFTGQPKRGTVWDAVRTNLPTPVQPGVTYRDIGIRLKITSVFADIERIVAEALGEIPVSDNATPQTNADAAPNANTASNADAPTPATPDAPPATDATQTGAATTRTPPTSSPSSTKPQTPARSSSRQARRP